MRLLPTVRVNGCLIGEARMGGNVARARILLADDHKEFRDRAVRLLEPEFEVVGAVADGNALVRASAQLNPDVCVIDISMPYLNGIEAASN